LEELAEAEIKLSTLLLDFSTYRRRFSEILRSPLGFFTRLPPDAVQLKPAVTFLLQGTTLAFVILTASWALPRSVAGFVATRPLLMTGSGDELEAYGRRWEEVQRALPAEQSKAWREQEELMLALRLLPEDRFRLVLDRLESLKQGNPGLLAHAIDGSLVQGERFGGRGYILSFFLALDPHRGASYYQAYQLANIGPRHELPPHVDFLLRSVLLWYLTSLAVSRLVKDRKTPFVLGAYLTGFLGPLFQVYVTLLHLYLAAVLPAYIRRASDVLVTGGQDLGLLSGGVFPFENLMLLGIRTLVPALFVGLAVAALASGLRGAGSVPKRKAWTAAALGVALGLGFTEVAAFVLTLVLAPTGLLS